MVRTLLSGLTGIRPDPEDARRWVGEELDKAPYQEGLVDRFWRWLSELLQRLEDTAGDADGLSVGAAVLLAVLLLTLVTLVVTRVSREGPARRVPTRAVVDATVTADEHRRLAERALLDHDPALALVEAFRAVAARAVQRAVLTERPDLTAHELADELQPRFPEQADALQQAARLFDLVFYGDQPARAEDARAVLDLESVLAAARPAPAGETTRSAVAAVPR